MDASYWSPKAASLRICSSFSFLATIFCSAFGVVCWMWSLSALYWRCWVFTASLNCLRMTISFACSTHHCKPQSATTRGRNRMDGRTAGRQAIPHTTPSMGRGKGCDTHRSHDSPSAPPSHLQAAGLLLDLERMLLAEILLGAVVVVVLVLRLCLVLPPQLLVLQLLDGGQVTLLQLLGGLVVPDQHHVLVDELRLPVPHLL